METREKRFLHELGKGTQPAVSAAYRHEDLFVLVFFGLLSVLIFQKAFAGFHPMSDKDITNFFCQQVSSAKYFSQGIFPFWDKNVLAGAPAHVYEVVSNPINLRSFLLAALAPLVGYFNAYTLLLGICLSLMGYFTFRLCRRSLSLGLLPSLMAGVIYATNMGLKERVTIMPGAFVVLPLLIQSALEFSKANVGRQAVVNGCLLAIAFYMSSLVAITWVLFPFGVILGFRYLYEKKDNGCGLIGYLQYLVMTMVVFVLLVSAVLVPFLLSLRSEELSLIGPTGSRLVGDQSLIKLSHCIRFFHKYFTQQIFPFTELTGTLWTRYKLPILYKLHAGYWNSYSILFLPSLLVVGASYRRLGSRCKIVLSAFFLIVLADAVQLIVPVKNFLTILFLRHNPLSKMSFMLNLFGGCTVAVALDDIMRSLGDGVQRWGDRIFKYSVRALLALTLCAAGYFLVYLASPWLAHKAYVMTHMYDLLDSTRSMDPFRYNYKFIARSELTPWLVVYFLSKPAILTLLLIFWRRKTQRLSPAAVLLAILFLLGCDRLATLNLFASFNAYARHTVSEELPLNRFFLEHQRPQDRTVAITCSEGCGRVVNALYDFAPEKRPAHWGMAEQVALYNSRKKDTFIDGNPFRWMANKYWNVGMVNSSAFILPNNSLPVIQRISGRKSEYKGAGINRVRSAASPLLEILGTRFVLTTVPIEDPRLSQVYRQVDETICTFVYENTAAFPRAWLVNETLVVHDRDAIYDMMEERTVNLRKTALIGDNPAFELDKGSNLGNVAAEIVRHEPNRVTVEVGSGGRSLLVLSDAYFEGWSATVNGRPAPIYEVNGFMRGVVVEDGKNTVEFVYRPKAFFRWLGLNLVSILLVGAYLLYPSGRRRLDVREA